MSYVPSQPITRPPIEAASTPDRRLPRGIAWRSAVASITRPLHRRTAVDAMHAGFRSLPWRICDKLVRTVFGSSLSTRTRDGTMMVVNIEDFIGRYIYLFGVWEPGITAFLRGRLKPGDLFCDVGAHIGHHTLLAARAVGPGGAVVAIEPSPVTARALRLNIALNDASMVRVVEAAVADAPGTLPLYLAPTSNTGKTTTVASRGFAADVAVRAMPLEQILRPDEIGRVRLIKMDVEGAEGPILLHLLKTLSLYSPNMEVLVELADEQTSSDALDANTVIGLFAAAGFRAYAIPNHYDLHEYLDPDKADCPSPLELPLRGQTDVLFSRQKQGALPHRR
jgi:FkbM family methyltransferase